jgi:hypothetical protein
MATAINSGFRAEILNPTVTDAAWLPVTLTDKANNLCIRFRAAVDLYVALDDAGTTYFTVPSGQSFTIDWYAGRDTPVYLKAASGTGVAEIFATYA